ncbi:TetR/AcrR family transcriptional regulator [Kribbella deserti]|uniref:TetR/AcrR family transcriptional regulator n=1 Tax=Kribbella deserti TaxID=1926257 RepID=A0ABV6QJ22_9ACTN
MFSQQPRQLPWCVGRPQPAIPIAQTPAAERILAAAADLFYTEGIRTVGVDAIAAAAGVTKKTLYDRFGSKDNLIAAYLQRRDQRWHDFLDEQLRQRRATEPEQVILALFAALTDWVADHQRGCGFLNAAAELAESDHPAMPLIVGQKRWMRDEFAAQAKRGGFRRPAELADRLLLLHEGALVSQQVAAIPDATKVAHRAARDLLSTWPRR